MKNFLNLILIFTLSIVGLTSCSNDEVITNGQETAEIVAIVNQVPQTSARTTASKNVNRGSIYPWVSEVDMSFRQIVTGYVKNQNFVLVDNGGQPNFIVKNIGIGENEVVVTTKTDSDQLFKTEYYANDVNNITSRLNTYKAINPYVLYESTPFTQEITATGTNIVNVDLRTNHGRRMSSIRWANNAIYKTNGYAKVSFIDVNGVESTQFVVKNKDVVYNYWSDNNALDGNKVTIKAEIYSNNDVLVETFTREIEITASTSITCSYIITDSELFQESRVNLTFQEWVEIYCTDC